jgi:hypothetical protein
MSHPDTKNMDNYLAEKLAECLNRKCMNKSDDNYTLWSSHDLWCLNRYSCCSNGTICSSCTTIIQTYLKIKNDQDFTLLKDMIPIVDMVHDKKPVTELAYLMCT